MGTPFPGGLNFSGHCKPLLVHLQDRDKYVTGDFRFRGGYGKGNPRKMVRTWAEKEMRNLTRIHNAGLPCPQPILLRSHVLLMVSTSHI